MGNYIRKYFVLRKNDLQIAWKKAKRSKMCYLFLLPYALLFTLFYVAQIGRAHV